MGDMGDMYRAMKDDRRELRAKYGVSCPSCAIARPKAHPTILLPGQRCRWTATAICGHDSLMRPKGVHHET